MTNQIAKLFVLTVFLLVLVPPATAQMQVMPHWQELFTLSPGTPSATRLLTIDATTRAHVTVTAEHKTLSIALVSPTGTRYTIGTPAAGFESTVLQYDTPYGANYHAYLTNPAAGTWQLEVTAPNLQSNLQVAVTLTLRNSTVIVLVGGGQTMPVGVSTPLALAAFDGTSKLQNLTITALAYSPNGTASPVSFHDDGISPDAAANDRIYTAAVIGNAVGDYEVSVEVSGTASTGTFRRTAGTTVRAVPATAVLTGTFTDQGFDETLDGLADIILVTPGVTVTEAGVYTARVELRSAQGRTVIRSGTASLASGAAGIGVRFSAEEIIKTLGEDGPYTVSMVELEHHRSDSDLVLVDRRINLGNTQQYRLSDLQHERFRLTGTVTATPADLNGNGRYDQLRLTVGVVTELPGAYEYSGTLIPVSDGTAVGVINGSALLSAGTGQIELVFPGLPIGTYNIDGPYVLGVAIYGQGQSVHEPNAFVTIAYPASAFEVPPPPVIGSFAPTTGGAGMVVEIRGERFTGAESVKFNGMEAFSFTVVDDTTVEAMAPTGVTTGPISITTGGGTATSSTPFTVVSTPVIARFTPVHGTSGTAVTISGSGFSAATAVAFNGAGATSFTITGENTINAVVPPAATTGPISVTSPQGTGISSALFYLPPVLSNFSPTAGAPTSSVTITGTNFTGTTGVFFNGLPATFVVTGPDTINATVPESATSGPLKVANPYSEATSVGSFTVLSSGTPTITATATSTTSVSLTWTGDPNRTYEVARISNKNENFSMNVIAQVTGTSYADAQVMPGNTYLYNVRDLTSGLYSNNDYATTILFTDDPIISTSVAKAAHLTELRNAVNAMRVAAALTPVTWTDPAPGTVPIKVVHVTQLRTALTEALYQLARYPTFTDPNLTTDMYLRAVHFREIRALVK